MQTFGNIFIGTAITHIQLKGGGSGNIFFHDESGAIVPDGNAAIIQSIAPQGGGDATGNLDIYGFDWTSRDTPWVFLRNANNSEASAVTIGVGSTSNVLLGAGQTVAYSGDKAFAAADFVPLTDSAHDLGTTTLQWAEAHIDIVHTDDIRLSDGAAGTPSLHFQDIDTGVYLAATAEIGFAMAGAEIWRMTAPTNQSRLYGRETNDFLQIDGSAEQWQFFLNDASEFILGLAGLVVPNVNADFTGSSDDTVLIDSGHRLHIDTSTLEHKKDVKDYWRELADMPLPSPIRFHSKQQYHKGTKSPLNTRWQYGYSMESLEATDEYLVSVKDGKGHNYINRALMALQGAHILALEEEVKVNRARIEALESV